MLNNFNYEKKIYFVDEIKLLDKSHLNYRHIDLRDNSTSTLTLDAAFDFLVKTLLTFLRSLAVSVNL